MQLQANKVMGIIAKKKFALVSYSVTSKPIGYIQKHPHTNYHPIDLFSVSAMAIGQ